MIRFLQSPTGEIFRVLQETDGGLWLISHMEPAAPFFVASAEAKNLVRIETPALFLEAQQRTLTKAEQKRLSLIQSMLDAERCITDRSYRLNLSKEIAASEGTTTKRILRIYYRYLATGVLGSHPAREPQKRPEFDWAIQKFYFSAKKLSLRGAYDMMLVQRYTDRNGQIKEDAPTWNSFQRYYYSRGFHKKPEKIIAREGLSNFQRNHRPAFGDASGWRPRPGCYQMDATEADIYLVSRFDKSQVIGRPYVYMAVDTSTQLIAGIYVGLEGGSLSILKCLENAASDKVAFCRQYGIDITPEQWCNQGLPNEIVTDKGSDFCSLRVQDFCAKYGVEMQSLPPFRPDQKPLIEKSFDLLQSRYKPLLRGKGVIEDDAQERWSIDYRSQAVLNLDEFTAIVLYSVIYLNSGRILSTGKTPAQMWLDSAPSLLMADMEELHRFTLPRTVAKLTRKGITLNGLIYAPDNVDQLCIGEKYEVACDPTDSSCIFICQDKQFFPCILSSKFKQYSGLCEAELRIQKKIQSDQSKDAKRHEIASSVTATQSVQAIIQAAEQHREGIQASLTGAEIVENREAERSRIT